ncbi:MAG: hypothetical protein ACI31G_04475 [Bacilli bacterium]
MKKMTKKQTKIFEIVFYSIQGAVMLWGLTYVVLGLLGMYLPIPTSQNALNDFSSFMQKTFGLPTLYWGLIIFAVGALIMVIALLKIAKGKDKEFEQHQRRQARLNIESAPATPSETTNE